MKQGFPIISIKSHSDEVGAGPVSIRWSWPSISSQVWPLLGCNENPQPYGRLHRHPWYEAFSPFECSLTISWSQFHSIILRYTMSTWFFFFTPSATTLFALVCRASLFPTRLQKEHKLNLSGTWEYQDTILQILKLSTLSLIISQFVSYTQSNRDTIQSQCLWGSSCSLTQTGAYPQPSFSLSLSDIS